MKNSHKRNRYKKQQSIPSKYILMGITIVCICTIFLSLVANISGGPLNSVAGYVFTPMQKGINGVGSWATSKANDLQTLREVQKENKKLKKKVYSLRTQLNTIKLEKYELENYRKLLNLDAKYPAYDKIAASVVAKDSSNWFSTFTINRGSKDGIKKGMNVIADGGLVGIISDVGRNYSTVRTVINDLSNVSGMITNTYDNINVSGSIKEMNKNGVITFSELRDSDNKVKNGDSVVTSYVSDQYQQGILIGYVDKIEKDSNNLTKSGTITPAVDFAHIENVLVIKNLKQTGDVGNKNKTDNSNENQNK
ncbi:rod shape-determining protein MreC [Lachnobacterium bovis]|uniref:Cell shape-determining protein MreC n=1 Tax=Lachnobacterium bovis TaxID=140626 RepID=A0A1H9PYZ7_9FIRM|nr:rod shape-determining protein MreC [Lachnobacterium bovis]SER53414.1 rod shape-determining protein MreC [Lachnobacterium bovis]